MHTVYVCYAYKQVQLKLSKETRTRSELVTQRRKMEFTSLYTKTHWTIETAPTGNPASSLPITIPLQLLMSPAHPLSFLSLPTTLPAIPCPEQKQSLGVCQLLRRLKNWIDNWPKIYFYPNFIILSQSATEPSMSFLCDTDNHNQDYEIHDSNNLHYDSQPD